MGAEKIDPAERALYEALGRAVVAERKSRKLSQADLGAAIGMSQRSISWIEVGSQPVYLHVVGDIEAALELTRGTLLHRSGHVALDVHEAIDANPALSPRRKDALHEFYDYLLAQQIADLGSLPEETRRGLIDYLQAKPAG